MKLLIIKKFHSYTVTTFIQHAQQSNIGTIYNISKDQIIVSEACNAERYIFLKVITSNFNDT